MKTITQKKKFAKILKNGLVKFFNPDGSRCKDHPIGFATDVNFLKQNYLIT